MSLQTEADEVIKYTTTDVIISDYENKISQNIATKTLAASKLGEAPDFTQEEWLYLSKKSSEDEDTELKVITPAPLVTLKKGKTELNIGHAVKLVQKMEEKYPTGTGISSSKDNTLPPYYEEQVDESYIKKGCNGTPDKSYDWKDTDPLNPFNPSYQKPPVKTVNSNAYEIREAVLAHALSWVQYTQEFKSVPKTAPTEDDVLNVAQKFYKFVENRR